MRGSRPGGLQAGPKVHLTGYEAPQEPPCPTFQGPQRRASVAHQPQMCVFPEFCLAMRVCFPNIGPQPRAAFLALRPLPVCVSRRFGHGGPTDPQKGPPPVSDRLKPMKHPAGDLFVCDITDAILKDDLASMEHPFYSLSKKPDREPRRYEHKGQWIEFRPSIKGLPTIYDKDLIIYAISQLIAGMKEGRPLAKRVQIDPYAFLVFTQRGTGGRDYDALCDSLDRIDGTRFRTNILFDGTRTDEWMGIIDGAKMETDEATGKIRSLELRLSDVVISSVEEMDVLTLHRDYFRLSRPIERRIYEIARKSVGHEDSWSFKMETLHRKSGSKGSLREFRRQMKPVIEGDYLPDYRVTYAAENDVVTFHNRNTMPAPVSPGQVTPSEILVRLTDAARAEARNLAPGWDVQMLAEKFAMWWCRTGQAAPSDADALFLSFCRSWQDKNGAP